MRVRGRVRVRGRERTNREAERQRGVRDRGRVRGRGRTSREAERQRGKETERQRHTKCLGLTLTLPLTLSL
jgi:hypothetical protein